MKKVFAMIAFAAITIGANAQQKGGIFAYGNVGFSSGKDNNSKNENSSFQFSPGIGYQFNKNWSAGLSIDINSNKVSNSGTDLSKNSAFNVGPFVRYTKSLSSTFSILGQFDAMINSYKSGVVTETKWNGVGLNLWPALQVNASKCLALNFSFGGLSYTSSKSDVSGAQSVTNFGFNFGKTMLVGVQFNF